MRKEDKKEKGGGAIASPRPSPSRLLLVTLFALLSGLLAGMGSKPPQTGVSAPSFDADTLEGGRASLNDYKGKVVVLTFWATWCEPCKKEMPEIQAAYEKYKEEGLVVVGVNFGETKERAEPFVKQMGLSFPNLLDRRALIAERYGVVSLPVTFFIDREGIIRERVFGGTLTEESIAEVFQRLKG